ncbi:MAG: ATP-dependent DNA helicase [Acidobacteria bacterium]|uniref:ATP-dependent DNA helicase n=1 Tax=Candidatus Polarisedimenticola svalbardensis TaxID=2886004 RepID=A0A8J7CE80_9BACT|nr:ATP-dependent DNA helicase [Candidatus Polarisedimenticola svalbardensis]
MSSAGGSFFAPHGLFSQLRERFEHRAGQEAMSEAVGRTLEGGVLMVEAGTGTGKTLAYLVPAIESGRRVIISTGTKNLQDQIFGKDLPFLAEEAGMEFDATLMKGRQNYLCRYRFAEFDAQPLLEVRDEARWIDTIRDWSLETETGDRAEIGELPDRLRLWNDINAKAETCTGRKCPEYEECWLTKMKRAAGRSSIVVVNHHLFFADLALRSAFGSVLPDYDTVVFDEAHLLEDVVTLYFGEQVSAGMLEDLARETETLARQQGGPRKGGGGAATLRAAAADFFDPVRDLLRNQVGRLRFQPADRGGPDIEPEWEVLSAALDEVGRSAPGDDAGEMIRDRIAALQEAAGTVLVRTDQDFVYGMEQRGRNNVILSAAPIEVSSILREKLFEPLTAAVLTSATLTVDRSFDFFKSRLGLDGADSLTVESSFDHTSQGLLYLPTRMPEPREAGFTARALEEIEQLLEITTGRAFLLFTSYAMMDRVRDGLELEGRWNLFVQGDGSKVALVEEFRNTEDAVLLGTTSFWQGVDVPGEALSLVVIDKLPFGVPGDPLVSARIDRIKEHGGNPFREYQTPMAVLELKQGLGRLIRSRSDRGLLAVLDPRLTTRSYGKTFLRSLPPWPVVREIERCREFFHG